MKKIIFLSLLCLFAAAGAKAQDFSCPQIDCPGQCGAFVDENRDGFCDHGQLSEKVKKGDDQVEKSEKKTIDTARKRQEKESGNCRKCCHENCKKHCGKADTLTGEQCISVADTSAAIVTEAQPARKKSRYHLLSISIGLLLLYLLSTILTRTKKMSKALHRKLWNIGLTLSFIVSGLLGMLLVAFINYDYRPDCYRMIKVLHVEFGIALAVISIFHILWHLTYFKNIFKKSIEG